MAAKLVDWRRNYWKRIEKPQQLKLIFGANLNILISSVTLYGRAENNLPKSFIARTKQLQGFTGFKTEIQVRNVLSFLWNNFSLIVYSLSKQNSLNHIFWIDFLRETLETF